MSKQNRINWLAQERIDIPTYSPNPVEIEIKSHQEIMNDMMTSFYAHTGELVESRPGSMFHAIFSIVAEQLVKMQAAQTYPGIPAPQTWAYPDGTKATRKPGDGEVFRKLSSNAAQEDCYIWYDQQQNWKWIGAKIIAPTPKIEFIPITIHIGNVEEMKCECGSEKSGSNKHSDWCKKYDPNT